MTLLKTGWTWKTCLVTLLVLVFVPFGFLLVLKWLFGENLNIGKKFSAYFAKSFGEFMRLRREVGERS